MPIMWPPIQVPVLSTLRRVTAKIQPGESLLLAGSHYLVGDFLARKRA